MEEMQNAIEVRFPNVSIRNMHLDSLRSQGAIVSIDKKDPLVVRIA